jgi:hypothetical protein
MSDPIFNWGPNLSLKDVNSKTLSKIVGNWMGSQTPEFEPENIRTFTHKNGHESPSGFWTEEYPNDINLDQYRVAGRLQQSSDYNEPLPQKGYSPTSNEYLKAKGTLANELTHLFQGQELEQGSSNWVKNMGGWEAWGNKIQDLSPFIAKARASKSVRESVTANPNSPSKNFVDRVDRDADDEMQSSIIGKLAFDLTKLINSEKNQPSGTRPR